VEKMYRKIWVHPQDKSYQLMVWRRNPLEKMLYFHLNTVTYGTVCAPYLETKCFQHLAQRAPTSQRLGADAIQQKFYVDDCLSGADTLEEAIRQRDQIAQFLGRQN